MDAVEAFGIYLDLKPTLASVFFSLENEIKNNIKNEMKKFLMEDYDIGVTSQASCFLIFFASSTEDTLVV